MKLYKITVEMPVYNVVYYAVAEGFDAAVKLVMEAESVHGGRPGGIEKIELAGSFDAAGEEGANLLLCRQARAEIVGEWPGIHRG